MTKDCNVDELLGENFVLDKGLIKLYGYDGALSLNYIAYWIVQNEKRSHNLRDGFIWVYFSIEELLESHPWTTYGRLRNALAKLKEAGVIVVGCYNKMKQDNTKWYRINEENSLMKRYMAIMRKRLADKSDSVVACKNNKPVCKNSKRDCKNNRPLPKVLPEVIPKVEVPPLQDENNHRRAFYQSALKCS